MFFLDLQALNVLWSLKVSILPPQTTDTVHMFATTVYSRKNFVRQSFTSSSFRSFSKIIQDLRIMLEAPKIPGPMLRIWKLLNIEIAGISIRNTGFRNSKVAQSWWWVRWGLIIMLSRATENLVRKLTHGFSTVVKTLEEYIRISSNGVVIHFLQAQNIEAEHA